MSDLLTSSGDDPAVQLLTPEGELVGSGDVTGERLRDWYRDLVLVRRIDTEAIALQRQGELGLWPSLLGQEAAQVGSARALAEQDMAFTTYREHGVAYARGVDPVSLLGMFRGSSLGGWNPGEHHLMPYAIVIGTQTLHATGYAMGVQRDGAVGTGDPGRDTAVICYLGDGATSQGDVGEAFNYAAVFNAPVVFVVQNNGWAISEPNERQFRAPLYRRAAGYGFEGVRVDGNDVLAVHEVTRAALDRARAGEGPTLIEAMTYRMGAHTTSDDPTRYRIAAEVEEWKLRDPIARVRAVLTRGALADEAFFAGVDAESERLAEHLRAGCRAIPDPAPERMFDGVYAEPHPGVEAGRSAMAAYEATFEGAR